MDNQLQKNHVNKIKDHIRWRAVVLGLILASAVCLVTPFNNVYRKATPLGGGHFPLAPYFILFLLTLFIAVVNRSFKRSPLLTGKELLLVWIQVVLVSGIAYTGLVRTLFVNLLCQRGESMGRHPSSHSSKSMVSWYSRGHNKYI